MSTGSFTQFIPLLVFPVLLALAVILLVVKDRLFKKFKFTVADNIRLTTSYLVWPVVLLFFLILFYGTWNTALSSRMMPFFANGTLLGFGIVAALWYAKYIRNNSLSWKNLPGMHRWETLTSAQRLIIKVLLALLGILANPLLFFYFDRNPGAAVFFGGLIGAFSVSLLLYALIEEWN